MGKIRIDAGVALVAAAVLITQSPALFLIYGASVLLHELGHLLAARLLGIGVKEVRVDITGFRIVTEEGIGSYLDEVILSAAGPLVNVAIVLFWWLSVQSRGISLEHIESALTALIEGGELGFLGVTSFFALSSVLQGAMNLLPIKTLDGGRILYCIIAKIGNSRIAERTVAVTGAVCAFVIWSAALYLMIRIGSGLGIYVFCACLFFGTIFDTELVKKTG